jgi:hypothetical protein
VENTLLLIPHLLAAADEDIPANWSPDVHKQPFKTLVCSFPVPRRPTKNAFGR